MRRVIVLPSNEHAVGRGEQEVVVEKVSEHGDFVRPHCRSRALLGIADFVLERFHERRSVVDRPPPSTGASRLEDEHVLVDASLAGSPRRRARDDAPIGSHRGIV
jgi:hypothetical protein